MSIFVVVQIFFLRLVIKRLERSTQQTTKFERFEIDKTKHSKVVDCVHKIRTHE